jgi:hypothetical protein
MKSQAPKARRRDAKPPPKPFRPTIFNLKNTTDITVNNSNSLFQRSHTIWIGKRDFLIHQVRSAMSAKASKAIQDGVHTILATTSMKNSKPNETVEPAGQTRTETHFNIVINPKLSAADFTR